MPEAEKTMLGIMELVDAKRLKEKLAEMGVGIELGHNKETCTKGCKVTVEVWADPVHLPKIQAVLREEHAKLLDDLDVDPDLANQVFDPDKENAICPACGAEFSTELKECPECGLVFMAK
jgi:hypothetical protein